MAKRSSVPGRAGHISTPYDRTLSHVLWRGATMLVAASTAGVVFAGPHAEARASDMTPARPLVAQQPAAGPAANPAPGGSGRLAARWSTPSGVGPQLAPHAPVQAVHPDPVNVGLPEYVAPAPHAVRAAAPVTARNLLAEAAAKPEASPGVGARLAFDRSLTWTGAGVLGVALAGLIVVARHRRAW